jgi:3',5'-cyclic AMP phosphodiesterase CpdA
MSMFADRRRFLSAAALGAVALGRAPAADPAKRVLRVAHLTDTHIQPELRAGEGVSACLKHVNETTKPDLILTGGDHVMDSFAQTRGRTQLQWDLWAKTLQQENGVPAKGCVGNHDIWGWHKEKSQATGSEPGYGKKWACDALGLDRPYYSFQKAGWKFIALDGVQPGAKPGGYSAHLDEPQRDWLTRELRDTPATTPVLVWSHIPIVSVLPTLALRQEPTGDLSLKAGSAHTDAGAVVALLAKHPNVKACLSGHLHLLDEVRLGGVGFHCNGAVSGNWWKGRHQGVPEGYAVVDLFADGRYTVEYVTYGWRAEPAKA